MCIEKQASIFDMKLQIWKRTGMNKVMVTSTLISKTLLRQNVYDSYMYMKKCSLCSRSCICLSIHLSKIYNQENGLGFVHFINQYTLQYSKNLSKMLSLKE